MDSDQREPNGPTGNGGRRGERGNPASSLAPAANGSPLPAPAPVAQTQEPPRLVADIAQSPPTAAPAPAQPLTRPARRTFPPPVLIATADPSLSRMLGFALNQLRFQYRVLDSGSVALRELLSMNVGAQPPVVVLDVDLPGVDGHAILERIAVSRPDSFLIVVLSSHADESVQVRSLLAGAIDHLAKPFNVRLLMAKIQRWMTVASHLAGAG